MFLISPATPEVGSPFPHAVVENSAGKLVGICDWPGLVLFLRGHWCGHCQSQLNTLSRHSSGFAAAGVPISAISTDDVAHCRALQHVHQGRIRIYRDPEARLIRMVGLEDQEDGIAHVIARPATFIVDRYGIVRYRYVSRTPEDRPTPDLLLLAVESLPQASSITN